MTGRGGVGSCGGATLGIFALLGAATACGGAQPEAEAPLLGRGEEGEPAFEVRDVGPLAEATPSGRVPFLVGAGGAPIDVSCFERAAGLRPWETRNAAVLGKLEEHRAAVEAAILAWVDREILSPAGLAKLRGGLEASFSRPHILHAPDAKVRFAPGQECVGEKTRDLPAGARAATTLVGARTIALRGSEPISGAQLKLLRKAAKRAKVGLRPAGGKPVTGFELLLAEPLWFAWGDLPTGRWKRENDPAACRLNVVDYDATPRVPECDPKREAGFGVEPGGKGGGVVLKVASDGQTSSAASEYGKTTMVQAGGRVVVWITATAIEEGAELQVDSLVLMPGGRPEGGIGSFGTPAPDRKKRR